MPVLDRVFIACRRVAGFFGIGKQDARGGFSGLFLCGGHLVLLVCVLYDQVVAGGGATRSQSRSRLRQYLLLQVLL